MRIKKLYLGHAEKCGDLLRFAGFQLHSAGPAAAIAAPAAKKLLHDQKLSKVRSSCLMSISRNPKAKSIHSRGWM